MRGAFQGCSKLTSVVKAGGVSPGASAFQGCTSLKSIDISGNTIGASAFKDCVNLTSVSRYPRSIGAEAFRNCRSLTGEISLLDNVIGSNAFANTGFSTVRLHIFSVQGPTVEFEKGVPRTIQDDKIKYSRNIESEAFAGCLNLREVTIEGRDVKFQIRDFFGGVKDTQGGQFKSTPSGLFSGCTALTTVNLTNVTAINERVFSGCTSLASFTIPPSVTVIYSQAFSGCTALTTVEIARLGSLGKGAFQNCTSLTTVTIKGSVTYKTDMGGGRITQTTAWDESDNAFAGCRKLTLASQADLRKMGYTGSF